MSQQQDEKLTPPVADLISKYFAPSPPPVRVELERLPTQERNVQTTKTITWSYVVAVRGR